MKFWQLFVKATALALVIAALLLLLTAAVIGVSAYRKADRIASAAGLSLQQLISEARLGWKQQPTATDNHKNILVLGTDELATRPGSPALTDTMLLVSLNLQTGSITGLSFPRDLWSDTYKTKINALYSYGQERFPGHPEKFPTQVLSEVAGVPIHHTLVITMNTLAEVVDALGGVDVTVTEGFTDAQFPRPDVNVTTEHDPKKLYMTVSFEPGVQHMNGARVLEYVRSRHATGDQGTDNARSIRQQQVVEALMQKAQQRDVLTNQDTLTKLLTIYQSRFQPALSVTEGVATLKALLDSKATPRFNTIQLPVYPDDPSGVIFNPKNTRGTAYSGQWVYVIKDQTALQSFIHASLLQ